MARRFRFRLETVQKLRRRAQDAQRRTVASRLHDVAGAAERIAGWEHRIKTTVSQTRASQQAAHVDIAGLRVQHAHRGWLRHKVSEAGHDLARARKELAVEQGKLAEAARRLKVIEKLRERQWERHALEVAREERALADEAAGQMYLRRQRALQRDRLA